MVTIVLDLVVRVDVEVEVVVGIVVEVEGVGEEVMTKGREEEGGGEDEIEGSKGVAIMLHLNVWHESIRIDEELQFSIEMTLDPL